MLTENERLPTDLGWHRQRDIISFPDLSDMLDRVINATLLSPELAEILRRRGGLHAGQVTLDE
jgi:hypothetical protein